MIKITDKPISPELVVNQIKTDGVDTPEVNRFFLLNIQTLRGQQRAGYRR